MYIFATCGHSQRFELCVRVQKERQQNLCVLERVVLTATLLSAYLRPQNNDSLEKDDDVVSMEIMQH